MPASWPKKSSKWAENQVLQAPDALEIIASNDEVDTVMAAIVGAAGLAPCLAAARAGKRLLLANKEALVVGGDVFMQTRCARAVPRCCPSTASIRPSFSACPKIQPPGRSASTKSCSPHPAARSARDAGLAAA
jgi:hypothetical protein